MHQDMPPRRRRARRRTLTAGVAALVLLTGSAIAAIEYVDVGLEREQELTASADALFGGIGEPLTASEVPVAGAKGAASVALSSGLQVTKVFNGDLSNDAVGPEQNLLDNVGGVSDMIALWPSDSNPRWAFVCNEGDSTNHLTPGVYRLKLRGAGKGTVETVLTGTRSCDGIRRTPWNTIVATEERSDGSAIEIYRPVTTTGVRFNRLDATVQPSTFSTNVVPRLAMGRFAWEGFEILEDGTVYAGDELSPQNRQNGGPIFKFVSDLQPPDMSRRTRRFLADPANAGQSPLAAGKLYVLAIGNYGQGGNNEGQGNQTGLGTWVGPIANPADVTTVPGSGQAREQGKAIGTGFYRPEDLHLDPIAMDQDRIRFCWANTGNSDQRNYGEVLCAEETPEGPEVQPFILGSPLMNAFDNLAFQPKTGILYILEDTPTIRGEERQGDIWACLRDGGDVDIQTDGCVRVASVRTLGAEPTGLIFDGDGERAYLNIQHSPDDPATADVDESTYDDFLVIDGFDPEAATAARSYEPFGVPTPTGTTTVAR